MISQKNISDQMDYKESWINKKDVSKVTVKPVIDWLCVQSNFSRPNVWSSHIFHAT